MMRRYLSALLLTLCALTHTQARSTIEFDFDWQFALGEDTTVWTAVQLPHDWNVDQQFRMVWDDGGAAYLPDGTGWYRKTFRLPRAMQGKRVRIHFDGIMMQSDVWLNGHHLGHRPYGYCSIEYDLTPWLDPTGENVLMVHTDTRGGRPRWYAGGGIYRHAWLTATDPVHVATYGTYVTTPEVTTEHASVRIVTTLQNETDRPQRVSVRQTLRDATGRTVAKGEPLRITLAAGDSTDVAQTLLLPHPQLWSPATPTLYTMETAVEGGGARDKVSTPFGVRTFRFSPDEGFSLNGERLKLQGFCLHEDAGCMGTAVEDAYNLRRLRILKEYGVNAIRCAHNQPSPGFLDMCDSLGFIVIDEAFDKWKSGYYEKYFDAWWQADMTDMILRDRNHPSIVLWSIGNELQEAWDEGDTGVERARMLQDFVHALEPTRPCILAAQNRHVAKFAGVTDVVGYNYLEARMLTEHKTYPERCFVVTEELPYYCGEEGNIRSYTPVNPWNIVRDNDFIAGGFLWSGVDYLGEAGWPSKGWPTGLFDLMMHEKPRAAYHRSQWNATPMVHIGIVDNRFDIDPGRDLWQWPPMLSTWNLPYPDGLVVEVRTVTNCDAVELVQNGKVMGRHRTADFPNHTVTWNIPYHARDGYTPDAPAGTLEARGYNRITAADGTERDTLVATYRLVVTGRTEHAVLTADRTCLRADGHDLAFIDIRLEDADGHLVQDDDRRVRCTVEGEALRLRGVENGDLRTDSFVKTERPTRFGQAQAVVQATRTPGTARLRVEVEGIAEPYYIELTTER